MESVGIDFVLSGVGSSIMAIVVTHILNKRRNQTEIESLVVNQYKSLVDDLREEVTSLRNRMDTYSAREERLNEEISTLRRENKELRAELEKLKNS